MYLFKKNNQGFTLVESLSAISLAFILYTYGLARYNEYVEYSSFQKEEKRLTNYVDNLYKSFEDYNFAEVKNFIDTGNQNSQDINVKRNDYVASMVFANFDDLKNNTIWGGDFELRADANSVYFNYTNIPKDVCVMLTNKEIGEAINKSKWTYISSDSLAKTLITENNFLNIKTNVCSTEGANAGNGSVGNLSFYIGQERF